MEKEVRKMLAVGLDREDAEAAPFGACVTVAKAWPGQPSSGQLYDRVVYGPRLKAILDWHTDVVLTRVKS